MAHVEEYAYEYETLGDSLRWEECIVENDPRTNGTPELYKDSRRILYMYQPDNVGFVPFKLARNN